MLADLSPPPSNSGLVCHCFLRSGIHGADRSLNGTYNTRLLADEASRLVRAHNPQVQLLTTCSPYPLSAHPLPPDFCLAAGAAPAFNGAARIPSTCTLRSWLFMMVAPRMVAMTALRALASRFAEMVPFVLIGLYFCPHAGPDEYSGALQHNCAGYI